MRAEAVFLPSFPHTGHSIFCSTTSDMPCVQCVSCPAVYEAGRLGAAAQEKWWADGGQIDVLMSASAAKAGAVGVKRRRQQTEAAVDKENLQ